VGGRAADFVAFDQKPAHGHVVSAVQEVFKTASKGGQNGSHCPGNERCEVDDSYFVSEKFTARVLHRCS